MNILKLIKLDDLENMETQNKRDGDGDSVLECHAILLDVNNVNENSTQAK